VKDIAPLAASPGIYGLATANGQAFFEADDGIHGYELWQSDGTSAGTFLAADLQPGPESSWPAPMPASGRLLIFSALPIAYAREAGETRKAIVVPFDADGALTGNRVLYVRLHDLHGAIAAKSVAAILVEDAEVAADLETKLALDGGSIVASVTNHGPLAAHDVQLTLHRVSDPSRQVIELDDLQPGETRSTKVAGALAFGASAIAASSEDRRGGLDG